MSYGSTPAASTNLTTSRSAISSTRRRSNVRDTYVSWRRRVFRRLQLLAASSRRCFKHRDRHENKRCFNLSRRSSRSKRASPLVSIKEDKINDATKRSELLNIRWGAAPH